MQVLLVALACSGSWLGGFTPRGGAERPATLIRCRATTPVASIEANEQCAQEQRDAYFALMPSQVLPTTSLDLRAWAPKDKDKFEAQVVARQEGNVANWRNIGVVAAMDEASFSAAVAKQRPLIERWAYEVCNDFETNELLMRLDGPPIELGWVIRPKKPSFFEALAGQKAEPAIATPVPADTGFDDGLECGFLGQLAREFRGGGVSSRSDRIVIGQEPEVPLRLESQDKYDDKYKGGGGVSLAKAAPDKK